MSRARAASLASYLFAAPAFILLTVLFIAPAVAVVAVSFSNWDFSRRDIAFVGVANYAHVFADPMFREAFSNTLFYVAVVVPVTIVLGLLIALLLSRGGALANFYRAAYFLPVMATTSAMALAWQAMLHPTVGVVNAVLRSIGLSGANWLRDPDWVLATLCAIGVWQHVGLAMILCLAGLQTIPRELYWASEVDGAHRPLDRFLTVTLPGLRPVLLFVSIVIALRAFEVFDTVRMLTRGGPGFASETLLHTLYTQSFEYFRAGSGAVLAVIFLLIVVFLSLLQTRAFGRSTPSP